MHDHVGDVLEHTGGEGIVEAQDAGGHPHGLNLVVDAVGCGEHPARVNERTPAHEGAGFHGGEHQGHPWVRVGRLDDFPVDDLGGDVTGGCIPVGVPGWGHGNDRDGKHRHNSAGRKGTE